jgi:hypothetical protein
MSASSYSDNVGFVAIHPRERVDYINRCIWGETAGDVLCALRATTAQPDPYNNTVRRQQALDGQAEVLSQ